MFFYITLKTTAPPFVYIFTLLRICVTAGTVFVGKKAYMLTPAVFLLQHMC